MGEGPYLPPPPDQQQNWSSEGEQTRKQATNRPLEKQITAKQGAGPCDTVPPWITVTK